MSVHSFLLCLVVGSALLAAWVVARLARGAALSGRAVTLLLVGAALTLFLAPQVTYDIGVGLGSAAAVLLVAFPACTYIFVAAGCLMLFVARAIAPFAR